MKIGRIYKSIDSDFPFKCPYGVFVEKCKAKQNYPTEPLRYTGWLRFVWNGIDMITNGGTFQEVDFKIIEITDKGGM